jgi:hypothetical protein
MKKALTASALALLLAACQSSPQNIVVQNSRNVQIGAPNTASGGPVYVGPTMSRGYGPYVGGPIMAPSPPMAAPIAYMPPPPMYGMTTMPAPSIIPTGGFVPPPPKNMPFENCTTTKYWDPTNARWQTQSNCTNNFK